MQTDEKLIYMANQIATALAAQGEARAVPAIADHLNKFWDPDMRRKFMGLTAKPETKLHPLLRKALGQLHVKTA